MSRTTLWNRLSQLAAPSRRPSAPKFARRPSIEGLEDRKLMAVTDLADAALLVGHVHSGTHLYVNFDGGTAPTDFSGKNLATIRAFETEAGDTALNRQRDIQDILFQVAEVYSPFDVQVQRIYGAGAYSTDHGDTTIFVGANNANSTINVVAGKAVYTKYLAGFTPAAFSDTVSPTHEINSDPYDIGFVDPVSGTSSNFSNLNASLSTETQSGDSTRANIFDIRRSIAHEAGHTFGLDHVRTDGLSDPSPVGSSGKVKDIQSYDSSNVFFANQRLTLTTINNTPTGNQFNLTLPSYHDAATNSNVTLTTENSYLTLGRVLGFRPQDQVGSRDADISTVDPVAQRSLVDQSTTTRIDGYVGFNGDRQVFKYTPAASAVGLGYDQITVHATFGGLRPEILAYDATGKNLISVAYPNNGVATLTKIRAGTPLILAIGGIDGVSTGAYYVTINHETPYQQYVGQNDTVAQAYLATIGHSGGSSQYTTLSDAASQYFLLNSGGHSGLTSAINSIGLSNVVAIPTDPSAVSLDFARIARLDSLVQVQAISEVTPVDVTPSIDPSLVDPTTDPTDPATVDPTTDGSTTDPSPVTDPATTDVPAQALVAVPQDVPSPPATEVVDLAIAEIALVPVQSPALRAAAVPAGRKAKYAVHVPAAQKVTVGHGHPAGHLAKHKAH